MNAKTNRFVSFAVGLGIFFVASSAWAGDVVVFQGGPRDMPPLDSPNEWNDTFNWDGVDHLSLEIPNNTLGKTYDVLVDDGDALVDRVANVNISVTIDRLVISPGDAVDVPDARRLTLAAGGMTNDGLFQLLGNPGSSSVTQLRFEGIDQLINGSGEIHMNDDSNNGVGTLIDGLTITHGANHLLHGGGAILFNEGSFVNQGTILADSTRQLIVNPGNDPGEAFTNQGIVRAENAMGLRITDGLVVNTGASLTAGDGSKLELFFNVEVQGGTLETEGTGVVALSAALLDGVTNNGRADQNSLSTVTVRNGLTNNGAYLLTPSLGSSSATSLVFDGSQTLGGTGVVDLGDDANNSIQTLAAGETITHGPDHTIHGGGALLLDQGSLLNEGMILADGLRQLIVNPGNDSGEAFTNQGVVRAESAMGMRIIDGLVVNTGFSLAVGDGSKLELFLDVEVQGGTLETEGTGVVAVRTALLNGVTNNGRVEQDDITTVTLRNGLTNNGVYLLTPNPGSSGVTRLVFDGSQTLGGTGVTDLGNDASNGFSAVDDATIITIGPDQTVLASGFLLEGLGGIVNNGTIVVSTRDATVNPGTGGFVNNGVIKGDDDLIFAGAATFTNDGVIAPGLSAGTLTIQDDVALSPTSRLEIELAGASAGQFDVLAVLRPGGAPTASVMLGGTLDVSTLLDFLPDFADEFEILTADGTVSGFFTNANPGSGNFAHVVENDVSYTVVYNPQSVVLTQVQAVPEPTSSLLLALGALLLTPRVRRRR
jgi:hypothetical protein